MSNAHLVLIVSNDLERGRQLSQVLGEIFQTHVVQYEKESLSFLQWHLKYIAAVVLDLRSPCSEVYEFLDKVEKEGVGAFIPLTTLESTVGDLEKYLTKTHVFHRCLDMHTLSETLTMLTAATENEKTVNDGQHDALTGLLNEDGFYQQARKELDANSSGSYDLIYCDIVRFKLINKIYGTDTGDHVLQCLAELLKRNLPSAVMTRSYADCYFILIRHCSNIEKILEDIAKTCHQKVLLSIPMHIQFGIYGINDVSQEISTMCGLAKMALSEIKGKYDVHVAHFLPEMYEQMLQEQEIVLQMENALKEHQFVVYYQPKWELSTGTVIGAEALVRWDNPSRGFLSPAMFIPLFEKNGFIIELDKYVWKEACRQLAQWKKAGIPVVPISVNMSRLDIYEEGLCDQLTALVKQYGIDPDMLHIEITESAYTQSQTQLIEVVNELGHRGFYIEMDDFGSGYSSLNMLSEVPVDALKLDMLFVNNRRSNWTSKRAILRLIMGIAKELDLAVIAEGVELEEDAKYLNSIGCPYAQGYYFSKPLPAAKFEAFFVDQIHQKNCTVKHLSFSPTSSSLLCGSYLASLICKESVFNVTLPEERKKNFSATDRELAVVSFPVYAGRVPSVFAEYLKEQANFKGADVALVATYGNRAFDDALIEASDLVSAKGGRVIGAIAIVAEHSFTSKVGTYRPSSADMAVIRQFAEKVKERRKSGEIGKIPGNRPYRKGIAPMEDPYMPEKKQTLCINCGSCYVVCPTHAWTTKDKSSCIHCCACIKNCPTGALFMHDARFDKTVAKLETNCKEPQQSRWF